MEPLRAGSRQPTYNYSGVVRGEFLPPIDLIVISCWGWGAGLGEGAALRACAADELIAVSAAGQTCALTPASVSAERGVSELQTRGSLSTNK